MGLWSKGVDRSLTGEYRLEDGDIFIWMKEICDEITRQWHDTCSYENQITPVGYMMIMRTKDWAMSFGIDNKMSKVHLLSMVRCGIENLIKKAQTQRIKEKLERLHFNNIHV